VKYLNHQINPPTNTNQITVMVSNIFTKHYLCLLR